MAFCGQAAAAPDGCGGGLVQPLCVVALGGATTNNSNEAIRKYNPVVYRIGAFLTSFAGLSQAKLMRNWR